jgi:hypothetical protein
MRSGWWLALVAVVGFILVGVVAYDAGVAHGAAVAGAAASGALPPYAYGWGWYRPWGFGFGFPLFILLFFWLVIARGFFWGRPWRRSWYDYRGDFDEWHRRAHERMQPDSAPRQ